VDVVEQLADLGAEAMAQRGALVMLEELRQLREEFA
jgi:hypothetical protein